MRAPAHPRTRLGRPSALSPIAAAAAIATTAASVAAAAAVVVAAAAVIVESAATATGIILTAIRCLEVFRFAFATVISSAAPPKGHHKTPVLCTCLVLTFRKRINYDICGSVYKKLFLQSKTKIVGLLHTSSIVDWCLKTTIKIDDH